MASSSASLLSPKHDVFLSFRGEDTRCNFISHLVKDFRNKKIQTFVDDEKLERGDEISTALMSAIEQSKISIIIFSENYADSKWCLEELLKIIECRKALKQIVIPVFYKVDPTHVRHQIGKFGTAFDRLLNKYQISPVNISASKEEIWRNALKRAANLSGFHALNNGSEATLVDAIIADVLKKLETGSDNSYADRGLVGLNSRVAKIMHLLDIESTEIRMVGIWGMGGMGKTTIAEALFNKLSSKFNNRSFLKSVRETVKKDGLGSLRDKLISKLLIDETLEIETPHIGNQSTKERLRRTKVLVVLDDVDHSSQLKELIGAHGTNQFGQGSIVIVTTRDKNVLKAHDITCVYNMQMLDDRDALELFRFYAFRQSQPIEPYLEFSKKIVEYAQGVPLALKVLGSSLRGKIHILDWEGELKKLKKLPNMEITNVLKTSYDGLTQEEKDIFLDIACFFKGKDVDEARNVLDSCYVSSHSAMEALIDKSLINISTGVRFRLLDDKSINYNAVDMHDLVQEMGRNIVNGESKTAGLRSRIWCPEDVRDVLTNNTGTDKIESILSRIEDQTKLDPQTFANMYNLKFLKLMQSDSDTPDWIRDIIEFFEFTSSPESLPEGLRYLDWYKYPWKELPPTFNPTNLVELHLPFSRLTRLWSGTQDLSRLKVLTLEYCDRLTEIPDLSSAVNLEELNLTGNTVLENISSSIQHLSSLKYLSLEGCSSFTEFPSSLPQFTSLKHLNLSDSNLWNISSAIQYLKNLTHLNLSFCFLLTEISAIKYLKNLTYLDLDHCHSLNKIPSSIQHLHYLTEFYIGGCDKIIKLPNLPQNIKILKIDCILIEEYSLLTHRPFILFISMVKLVLYGCTIDRWSSIRFEKIKPLVPPDCDIVCQKYGSKKRQSKSARK